jgi:hypothetical protein
MERWIDELRNKKRMISGGAWVFGYMVTKKFRLPVFGVLRGP